MSETTATIPVYSPFIETDAGAGAAELRAQMQDLGYLFFRGLLPADVILPVRRDILELCDQAGWLDKSRDLAEGIVAPGIEPRSEHHDSYKAVYRHVLKLSRFHDVPCSEPLMELARKLLGDDLFVHPRRIGRLGFPNYTVATTPPHQDFHYIRGTVETYSCWLPLGDCPRELGCLSVAAETHKQGFLEHSVQVPGAVGGAAVPIDDHMEWHVSDYNMGDVIFFTSYTIHRALPNLTENRLRLSTDNRYQQAQAEIHPGALQAHLGLN